MPNWCRNNLEISKEAKDKVFNKKGEVDFEILLPMPEALKIRSGSGESEAIYVYLSEKFTKSPEEVAAMPAVKTIGFQSSADPKADLSEIKIFAKRAEALAKEEGYVDAAYEDGRTRVDNFNKYGAINWYEWSCQNWGVKWNASDTEIVEENSEKIHAFFYTPWGPPSGWLSRLIKETDFTLEWSEEGGYAGYVEVKNGEVIKDEEKCWAAEYEDEEAEPDV